MVAYFQTLTTQAPLLLAGHPVSYTNYPEHSILNPFNDKKFYYSTVKFDEGQYLLAAPGGLYSTAFSKQSNFEKKEYQIGVQFFDKTAQLD